MRMCRLCAFELDEPGVRDALGQIVRMAFVDEPVLGPMQDEGWRLDLREDRPHVELGVHPLQLSRGARTGREPLEPGEPLAQAFIVGRTRCQRLDS